MFVIFKIDAETRLAVFVGACNDRLEAIDMMLSAAPDSKEIIHINNTEIRIYGRYNGWISSPRILESVVQVLEFEGEYTLPKN